MVRSSSVPRRGAFDQALKSMIRSSSDAAVLGPALSGTHATINREGGRPRRPDAAPVGRPALYGGSLPDAGPAPGTPDATHVLRCAPGRRRAPPGSHFGMATGYEDARASPKRMRAPGLAASGTATRARDDHHERGPATNSDGEPSEIIPSLCASHGSVAGILKHVIEVTPSFNEGLPRHPPANQNNK